MLLVTIPGTNERVDATAGASLARAVIQLARLVGNVLDSTDSGTP